MINVFKTSYSRFSASKNLLDVIRKLSGKPNYLKNYAISFKYISFSLINFMYVAKAESLIYSQNFVPKEESERISLTAAISQADELFSMGRFEESYKLLFAYKDKNNAEVLWRLSRALYNMSKQKGIEKSKNAALIEEAYIHVDRAVRADSKNYAVHKWMAILYDARADLKGIRARLNALPVFKQHLMRAIELNPKDATSLYMLGLYMYNIADMSKLQRMIAKSLFGSPPEATFEEAFYYFTKAEEAEPNFYSSNLLMLGKTCLKLKRTESARFWLKCAVSYPVTTDEDDAVRREAEELLKKNPGVRARLHETGHKNHH